jgi:hypothetical protein
VHLSSQPDVSEFAVTVGEAIENIACILPYDIDETAFV